MGPRAGLDGRKISFPPGFDPGTSSPYSVATPTELPGPQTFHVLHENKHKISETANNMTVPVLKPIETEFNLNYI